jgi:hypothetical protein
MTSYKGKDKDNFFLCEGRFGPAELPTNPSLAALLVDYDRQLNGNPKGFLEQFWGTVSHVKHPVDCENFLYLSVVAHICRYRAGAGPMPTTMAS